MYTTGHVQLENMSPQGWFSCWIQLSNKDGKNIFTPRNTSQPPPPPLRNAMKAFQKFINCMFSSIAQGM